MDSGGSDPGGRDAARGPSRAGGAGGDAARSLGDEERREPRAALPGAGAPDADVLPARPRPGHPLLVVPAARVQDPGLREPRGRQLPHPPHPQPGGRADRAHGGPGDGAERGADRVPRPRPRPRPHALRPLGRAGDERADAGPRRLRAQPPDAADPRGAGAALSRVPGAQPHLGGARGDHQAPPRHGRDGAAGVRAGGGADARGAARRLRGRDRLQQPRRGRRAQLGHVHGRADPRGDAVPRGARRRPAPRASRTSASPGTTWCAGSSTAACATSSRRAGRTSRRRG